MDIQVDNKTEFVTSLVVIALNVVWQAWEWATEHQVFSKTGSLVTFLLSTAYLYWAYRKRKAESKKEDAEAKKEELKVIKLELEIEYMQEDKEDQNSSTKKKD